jgi:predicted MFS family arabinose efflux permease
MAGLIVDHFGYNAAFLIAAGVATVALLAVETAMPETSNRELLPSGNSKRQKTRQAYRGSGESTPAP